MTTSESRASEFQELCALAEREQVRLGVPGVAIGVALGDQQHLAGLGVTSVEHPLAVDPDTLFQVGSITKTVTGTVIMRLAERGLLDLDAPVRRYLPELRLGDEGVAARVTLRHLLNHTAGWLGDYFEDMGDGDDALARIVARLAELPQLAPLGALWSYNNAAFYLAGRLVELAAGRPFERVAHDELLAPLGMDHSFFFPGEIMTYRFATGHQNSYDPAAPSATVARPWPLARTANPAGGLSSTVRDLLRYARFHMGDGRAPDGARLLTRESLEQMRAPGVAATAGQQMGVTWFLSEPGGIRTARHGGATNGQKATLLLAPERQFALALLTNADRGGELNQALIGRALELFLGVPPAAPALRDLSDERLAEYAGSYDSGLGTYRLAPQAGGLELRYQPKGGFPTKDSPPPPAPPPARLAFCGDDDVVGVEEPFRDARGEFLRAPDGSIAWFRFGSRANARV